jgi:hypothetical protein
MEQSKVLERVHKLLERAEHPGTDGEEAEACRAKADKLMFDYAIEQADLDASRPAEKRSKPETLQVIVCPSKTPIRQAMLDMVTSLASHCRLQVIFHNLTEYEWFMDRNVEASLFGYSADLRYFEMLFAIVHLHMSSRISPKADPSLSLDENVYNLHEAGIKWEKIADMLNRRDWSSGYGDRKTTGSGHVGNRNPATAHWRKKVRASKNDPNTLIPWPDGHRLINAYKRHCKAIGETPRAIPNPDIYRRSFAMAYASRLQQRLYTMQSGSTGVGTALDLRRDSIESLVAETFPELVTVERDDLNKIDYNAVQDGYAAANEVDLAGNRVKNATKGSLN